MRVEVEVKAPSGVGYLEQWPALHGLGQPAEQLLKLPSLSGSRSNPLQKWEQQVFQADGTDQAEDAIAVGLLANSSSSSSRDIAQRRGKGSQGPKAAVAVQLLPKSRSKALAVRREAGKHAGSLHDSHFISGGQMRFQHW
jgi:hypothetical protein